MSYIRFYIIGAVLLCAQVQAVQTAYLTFNEPDGWSCELAQGVWICQSNKEIDRKESVILSIAAQASEWDTLENYEKYLNRSKKIQNQDGTILNSKVVYTRRRNLNGFWWVDSLQKNSELPGFWARYLATIHTSKRLKLAILVTYIVSEERYSQLAPKFEQMVASLKPKNDVNISSKQGNEIPLQGDMVGQRIRKLIPTLLDKPPAKKTVEPPLPESISSLTMALLGGVLVFGIFLFRKRKRKGPSAPPSHNLPTKRTGSD